MKRLSKCLFLFLVGGLIYYGIEMLWRGHSHMLMALVGGICFLLCGGLNEHLSWDMPLGTQCLCGATLITAVEFVSGVIFNIWLGLDLWDYSDMPYNILGQICLPFFCAWVFLAGVAIVLDDYLRYWIFHEERPHYKMF